MKEAFKKLKPIHWTIIILAIAVDVFIIVNSCMNATKSSQSSGVIVNILKNIINAFKADTINEENIQTFSHFIRKLIGHFLLFTVSGVLTTLSFKFLYFDNKHKYPLFIIFSCIPGLFLAILTEIIQLFVEGRSGEIKDMAIDFCGYLLGLIIIILIVYLMNKKTRNMEIQN